MISNKELRLEQIEYWLREEDPTLLEELWRSANLVREQSVGDNIRLRALVEFSNVCKRQCAFCGLASYNSDVERYRLSAEEVVDAARVGSTMGCDTTVIQAGEDPGLTADLVAEVIQTIKKELGLFVTLSLGEQDDSTLQRWRDAGADRYLLRFETSDQELFSKIHPHRDGLSIDRVKMLGSLRKMGYEVGSGVMAGIPGQRYDSLARDIVLFRELNLDMIGSGPFIAHPKTPMGCNLGMSAGFDQVPPTDIMAYKVIALARLVRPTSNIPSTTAITALDLEDGRELALSRGANVVMLNCSPLEHRAKYMIYPDKARLITPVSEEFEELRRISTKIRRPLG